MATPKPKTIAPQNSTTAVKKVAAPASKAKAQATPAKKVMSPAQGIEFLKKQFEKEKEALLKKVHDQRKSIEELDKLSGELRSGLKDLTRAT